MSVRTVLAAGAVVAAALAVVLVLTGSDGRYGAKLVLEDAGGLRKGANVRIGGAPVGQVEDLVLDDDDHALATIRLDPSVAPIGEGARALIQADGFFGERYVEIDRGDVAKPQPDGSTIPIDRTSVSTRLDDLVDALDTDTRGALKSFLNEQGTLIVGRGRDLADVLAALPPGLSDTGRLLDQFAADNEALGRLVEESDRVVGAVAGERRQLGRMVEAASATLAALDTRRPQLGATVREAPATLRSAQDVLAALEQAVVPLAPAADGLRVTAPTLTATLRELPAFAAAAVPAFAIAEDVSPMLTELGTRATPTVRRLKPLARTLDTYATTGLDPFSEVLDAVAPDLFGLMEGWARSTMGFDESSRIFRFGATSGTDTFAVLLDAMPQSARKPPRRALPDGPRLPRLPAPVRDLLPPKVQDLLEDPLGTVDKVRGGRPVDAVKDVAGTVRPGGGGGGEQQVPELFEGLLGP